MDRSPFLLALGLSSEVLFASKRNAALAYVAVQLGCSDITARYAVLLTRGFVALLAHVVRHAQERAERQLVP